MARLSVATWPPPGVMAVLSELDRPPVPGVHWSRPEQWMVKVRPVECLLGPATRRIGGQWLGAPVAGLEDLAAVVFEATERLVPVTHPQPFQADIVLARGKVHKEVAGRPLSASWTARSLSLVADRSSPQAPGTRTSLRSHWELEPARPPGG